ncbi:MAG: tetratricopeptide repeat protein [Gammaproteobacteria bacterium]
MTNRNRIFGKLMLLLISGLFISGAAIAQDEESQSSSQKTKKAQAVSKQVYDKIQKAQEQIEAENYPEAMQMLNRLNRDDKLTDYERQNVLNYIGFVQYSTDDTKGAITTYNQMLQIPTLEEQTRKTTMYTLAQLNTMEEDYAKALDLLDEWFTLETNPQPQNYILYAQNLYQVSRYKDMVEPIETALRLAVEKDKEIKEDWYVLLNFAYFQQENYAKVRDIQKILLANWPKKRYWFSLAGAYTELGEDINLVASYDAAHAQGMLEKESELVTMAQLYMQHEVPYKAATLLDKEMESGRVQKNAKNYRILSQAWTLAMEDEEAIPALREAARLSDEGELNLRLGNAHLNLGQYAECVSSIQDGLRKGGIKSPDNAQISLGMCLYNQKKYTEAKAAFREASQTDRSKRISNQWVRVIDSDIQRNEQIRLAENAARKQQEELAKKRREADRS